ncbi:DUF4113 domain-containing protein [Janthinobacterium sp. 61]
MRQPRKSRCASVRRWAMLSENRTPRYATNWMELPKVRAQ